MGVSKGLAYASIETWMEVKISSGRQKDRAHIVEVLKLANSDIIERIRKHLRQVHESYEKLFADLLLKAQEERQQERTRSLPKRERR
jgi:hypothetical protein